MSPDNSEVYKYIVVGAGAAGCVVANRLSADPGNSVLLIEAGGSDDFFTNTRFLDLASLFSLWGPATDWGYSTEPSPGMNNRSIPITQGKVLGGGSSTNGRIYLRGNRRDYDLWASLGNDGWGYDDVLPFMKRYEQYTGTGEKEYHGTEGPLPVMDLPAPTPVSQAFMQSAIDHGFTGPADVNGHQQENAVGYCQSTTTPNMARASTSVAYIHPIMDRPNFTLLTDVHATRVLFEGTRAVGVEYLQDGTLKQVRAEAEVVTSCGGFNMPKLLMLSGIGPADHLGSFDIPVVMDLPGVGENLQDHLLARMSWHLKVRQPPLMILSEVNLFTYSRPGMEETESPNLQYMFAPFFFPEYGALEDGITLVPVISRPESRGTVRLRSADPLAPPVISPNYLSTDNDVQVLKYGLDLGRDLMSSPHLDPFKGEEVAPGPGVVSDDELNEYIRNTAVTVWHPSCSNRMGNDDMAVVDSRLRVHGIQGLRVVDCSVMPTIVNANLQATVIMIGEKGADMILADN